MPNGRNGPTMPMHFDGSGINAAPNDGQRSGPLSTTLASALASATPENQRMVCINCIFSLITHKLSLVLNLGLKFSSSKHELNLN